MLYGHIKPNLRCNLKNAFPPRGTFKPLSRECTNIKETIIMYALSQIWRLL